MRLFGGLRLGVVDQHSNRTYDIIVIGGGIAGLGIALEAARCGFRTILLEKNSICQETSDNSLRIIHGGLRYFQQFNLLRVVESLQEQNYWLKDAPSLVKRLPCIMPLESFGLRGQAAMKTVGRMYNALSEYTTKRSNGAAIVTQEYIAKYCPVLASQAPHGGFLWFDARLRDPAKFSALIRHRVDREGGLIVEHASVSEVKKLDDLFVVRCAHSDQQKEFLGRVVVNASGPWLETISYARKHAIPYKWCRAFNVVLKRKLQDRFGLGARTQKGRLLFVVPRASTSAIGTGYLPLSDSHEISGDEIAQFLSECNEALPKAYLKIDDVEAVESGLLPYTAYNRSNGNFKLLGRAKMIDHGGFIDVVSTKYTTFRALGKRVVRKAIKYLR